MSGTSNAQQLHGSTIDHGLEEGLKARTKDPLWFLARQWQMGEFEAESGGRPMQVRLTLSLEPLNKIRHAGAGQEDLDPKLPLEFVVEREPAEGMQPKGWRPERLAYDIALSSTSTALSTAAYDGRALDWHDFDVIHQTDTTAPEPTVTMTPGQFEIPGAPQPRWWQIEAGAEYFDQPQDPEPNILSMMLPEFFYTDIRNWYVVPLPTPAGSVRRISKVEVVDSFGLVSEVDPIIAPAEEDVAEPWAIFAMSGEGVGGETLFTPNTAVQIGANDLVEEVRFLRDEGANLAWAWERQITDENGELHATSGSAARSGAAGDAPPPDPAEAADLQFRLASDLDRAWIPYLPTHIANLPVFDGDIALRRGRSHEKWSLETPQYRGVIVGETPVLAEEEVPPGGIAIKRQHRYALDSDGQVHFWIGRTRDVAPKTPRPNLKFDYLIRKAPG